jgi:hypothetical protein
METVQQRKAHGMHAACTTVESPVAPLRLFYRSQIVLGLAVGVALLALPAALVEAPEPTFTAESLLRRCTGAAAATVASTANWCLLSAAARQRLEASTFLQLNATIGLVNCAVRRLLDLLLALLLACSRVMSACDVCV